MRIDVSRLVGALDDIEEQIESAIGERGLRAVGFAGAEVIREAAKRNAQSHVKTGVLYKNIIIKRLEEKSDAGHTQAYLVTVRKGKHGQDGDAYYAGWVEKGHKFVPPNKNVSARTGKKVGWKAHRAAAALEYGTASAPAYPFLRPAFDTNQGKAVDAMTAKLMEQIRRNARR